MNFKCQGNVFNYDNDTAAAAEAFWERVAGMSTQMRLTADQMRLADTECRLALEALVDASCKSSLTAPIGDLPDAAARQRAQHEQTTIEKLESVAVKAGKQRVLLAQHMLELLQTALQKLDDDDAEGGNDDEDADDENASSSGDE